MLRLHLNLIVFVSVITTLFATHKPAFAAGAGDSAPKKCTATDVEYTITNIVPSGACLVISDTITVDFDVNIFGNPQRYNMAVGYTNAGDSILQDVACLETGIDIDGVGCEDYDGSGTATAPHVASSTFSVSCDMDGNLLVDPLVGVDFYVSFDANTGGTVPAITAPKCLEQAGTSFPLAPAKLQLNKSVTNDNGGSAAIADWVLTANLGAGSTVLSGSDGVSSSTLPAGDYLLSETGPAGYVLDSIVCSGATFDAASSTLTLEPGQDASCVFNNNDDIFVPPTSTLLTLVKTIVNDNGGNAAVEDFDIAINGVEVVSGVSNTVAAGVPLLISELDLPSYAEGAWNCIDSTGLTPALPTAGLATGTTLNLTAGSNVVCSIENNDLGVDLSIVKTVSDKNPSIGEIIVFNLEVANAGPDDATDVVITDVLPAGFAYITGSAVGGDSLVDTDPQGAGLTWNINSLLNGSSALLSFEAELLAP